MLPAGLEELDIGRTKGRAKAQPHGPFGLLCCPGPWARMAETLQLNNHRPKASTYTHLHTG